MGKLAESPEIGRLKRKLGVEVLWLYILSLLKKKKSHAYVLRKEIEKEFDFLPGNVTAYMVLYKLESRAYVRKSEEGNKVIYTITPKGKALLKEAQGLLKDISKKVF